MSNSQWHNDQAAEEWEHIKHSECPWPELPLDPEGES